MADRREPRDKRAARLYAEAFPWADEAAMEIHLRLIGTEMARDAAQLRFFASLGQRRTRGRYTVLRLLHFAEGNRLRQTQIRDETGVTSPNVTYLINGLEEEGLVRRVSHPTDRRGTFVELTQRGREVCDALVPAMARLMTEMADGFTDAEKTQFIGYLERYFDNARNAYLE